MKSKLSVLIKALLLSTSTVNQLKYGSRDKRKKMTGGIAGMLVLYTMLIMFGVINCIGFGYIGMTDVIPSVCTFIVAICCFFFTMLKAGAYLYSFKEYDMLMVLPISVKEIVAGKFLYMYIKSLPIILCASVSMLIGYSIYAHTTVVTWLVWIVLSLVAPIIPTVIAAAISSLITVAGAGFRYKKAVQTILTFIFIYLCFCSRFVIEKFFRSGDLSDSINNLGEQIDGFVKYYPPAAWFENAVVNMGISDMLLLVATAILLVTVFAILVGKNYKKINTRLSSHEHRKSTNTKREKKRSAIGTLVFKDFKRMTGSTVYMTNACFGEVLTVVFSIAALVLGGDRIIAIVTQGAPLDSNMLLPIIPIIVYFLLGMVSTTVMSPSLEGKNYWIIKSLPIDKSTYYKAKMHFNMVIVTPFLILGTIALGIAFGATLLQIIIYLLCGLCMCSFSTTFGLFCGLKFINLEWENEVEVIKQGKAMLIYLFPNMFVTVILAVPIVLASKSIGGNAIVLILAAAYGLLAFLFYRIVMKYTL